MNVYVALDERGEALTVSEHQVEFADSKWTESGRVVESGDSRVEQRVVHGAVGEDELTD
jgi:hypothetical protein